MDGYTFVTLRNANAYIRERDETNHRLRTELVIAGTRIESLEMEIRSIPDLEQEIADLRKQVLDLRIEAAQHKAIRIRALEALGREDASHLILSADIQGKIEAIVAQEILTEQGERHG